MRTALTDKQLRFVFEYLQDQNAAAAARRAGFADKGSKAQGNALLRNPLVAERIRDEMRSLLAEANVAVMDLVRERVRAALFRADNMFGTGWELREREEVEPETRAALQMSATWRKGEPTLRVNQPSRERALAALEKLHERLGRQSEAHYAREAAREDLARDVKAAEQAVSASAPAPTPAPAPGMPSGEIMLDVHRGAVGLGPAPPPVAAGSLSVTWGGQVSAEVPAAMPPQSAASKNADAPPAPVVPEPFRPSAAADGSGEKSIVSSGSPEPARDPAPPAKLSPFAEVLAAARKEQPGGDGFRSDPNWMWGGKARAVPPPEPSASLLEHLANVKHTELNAQVAQEMARRGGRIRPGPLRPSGLPPGYNPPWLRDDRPRFAEGQGSFAGVARIKCVASQSA